MKAKVQLRCADTESRSGLEYMVGIQLIVDEEEKALIADYNPLMPSPLQFLNFGEHHQERVAKALRNQGAEHLLGFENGVLVGFKTINGANEFEEAVLKAFTLLRQRIDEARAIAAKLGVVREIDL